MPSLSRGHLIRAGTAALALAPVALRAQSDPLHLRVGTGSVEANAQIFYAADMGFFKKNGLDVDVQKLRSENDDDGRHRRRRHCTTRVANVLSLGAAHQRNVPLVMFAPGAYYDGAVPTTMMVVAPNSTMKGAKDLNGSSGGRHLWSAGSINFRARRPDRSAPAAISAR